MIPSTVFPINPPIVTISFSSTIFSVFSNRSRDFEARTTSAPAPAQTLAPGETHVPTEYSPPTVSPTSTLCFNSKEELRGAVELDVQGESDEWLLDTYGWIGNWCVSRLTDFSGLFRDLNTFNKPLNGWDMSNAKNLSSMFSHAAAFNQDLSTWNTSSFTDTSRMFRGASAFNQSLKSWDVSRVTTLYAMVRIQKYV